MNNRKLTKEELESFCKEIDAIRNFTLKNLGENDVKYTRKIIKFSRYCDVFGRILLNFGIDPITFILGVLILSISKIFETAEGHNLIHGQYDWTGDPELSSNYEWDFMCTSKHWKHNHNYEHHTFTNILGKDNDVGYDLFRISEKQKWGFSHIFQPFFAFLLMLNFEFGIAFQGRNLKEIFTYNDFSKKMIKLMLKDYIIYPILSFNFLRTMLGNFLANKIRSVWLFMIVWCGHFSKGVILYSQEECENESRGAWYLRQALGSANIEGNKFFYSATGFLSHQIEHHLFPDIPAVRYPEMAPKVKKILEKYDQKYNTDTFLNQFGSVIKNVVKLAIP